MTYCICINFITKFIIFVSADLPFYLLCDLLKSESSIVERTITLVFQEDVTRTQRTRSVDINKKLRELWVEFRSGTRSARNLLSAGSRLICPRPDEAH